MKRKNESREVMHLLDTFICPNCSEPSMEIIDHQYGVCKNDACDYDKRIPVRKAKEEDDRTKCVLVDNQLYCIIEDEEE